MIKIVLWRLGFEVANLRRTFERQPPSETEIYFAFGGNLNSEVLKVRKIFPLKEQFIVLKNFVMSFSQPGPWQGMGFASIEAVPGEMVYGKLYTISRLDGLRMDYYEAVPFLGRYERVYHTQDGVRFFFYVSRFPTRGLKPSRIYLDTIVGGLAPHVPEDYLLKLKATEALDVLVPVTDHSFFYSAPAWMPKWIRRAVLYFDGLILKFYVRFMRRWTFSERWIRPR
jgi:hypothetical protein